LEVNGELLPRPILVTRHPFTYKIVQMEFNLVVLYNNEQ
jgi:hypothetical protein